MHVNLCVGLMSVALFTTHASEFASCSEDIVVATKTMCCCYCCSSVARGTSRVSRREVKNYFYRS